MRNLRSYTIDVELIELLRKAPNGASETVNLALREYFKKNNLDQMSKEELEKLLAIEELKKKHKEELKALQYGS